MIIVGKFELPIMTHQVVEIPHPAKIISVINQRDKIVLYAEINPNSWKVSKHIGIYGTGHELSFKDKRFIGTVSTFNGDLIWHVYDETDYGTML